MTYFLTFCDNAKFVYIHLYTHESEYNVVYSFENNKKYLPYML